MAYDKAVDSAALDGALTGIADAIRSKTGGTGKLTLEGMAAAIAGISGGGGAGGIYMAQVTPESDVGRITVVHNLGTTDLLLASIWAESLGDAQLTADRIMMRTWLKSDIPFRITSSTQIQNIDIYSNYSSSAGHINTSGHPNSTAYLSEILDENTFQFASGTFAVARFAAGVTYTVIIVAASAFSAAAV